MEVKKVQLFPRILAILVLVLTACLVSLDTQTKLVFNILEKKATFKDLDALFVLVHVVSVAAGHHLLQLGLKFITANRLKESSKTSLYLYLKWFCFVFDQVMVYLVFATWSAALQASMLAVTGSESLQWMKVCNIFTRFCYQISGGLVCGFFAWFIMAIVSSISAFSLFCLYSPHHFMLLKP
ncbi:unnamed protein product [Rhodiola kirilowii]